MIASTVKNLFSSKASTVNTVIVIVAIVLAFVYPLMVSAPLISVGFVALLYAMRNFTWNIAGGFAGALSLAHVGAFGIGAFSVAVLTWGQGWNIWISIVVGIVISAVLGAAVSVVMSRFGVNAFFFAVGTLAVSMALAGIAASWSVTGAINGLQNRTSEEGLLHLQWFTDPKPLYYVALIMLVLIVIATAYMMKRTRLGRSLPFIREDPQMAASMGINVTRNLAWTMAISMGLTAIPGSLMVQYTHFASFDSVLTLAVGISMVMGAFIGGATTLAGPIVAGILIAALEEWLRSFQVTGSNISSITQIVYALLVILLIRFGAAGLVPLWNGLLQRLFREGSRYSSSTLEAAETEPSSPRKEDASA